MTYEIRVVNLILVVVGLAIAIVGLLQVRINRNIEGKTRGFLTWLFLVLNLYILSLLARGITYGYQGDGWVMLSRIMFFLQAVLAATLTVLITAFTLYKSGINDWWKHWILMLSVGLWAVYTLILIYNLFDGRVYFVNHDNAYERGPLYPVLLIPTVLIASVNLFAVWDLRDKLTPKEKHAFIIFNVAPMFAMFIQSRVFGIHFIALSSVIAAIFMLSYMINDQTELYYMKEAENAKLKLDILQAQIQPHFLFNSLTTIKQLCVKDPEKASEAIETFIVYLRHNMDSLTAEKPIDFSRELEHVKGYLELQKLRFGEDLCVKYDLEFTNFKIPTLALQPIVENAVTYGIRKSENGQGTVVIRTKKTGDTVEVIVEDDGPGFVPEDVKDTKNRAHIGIVNVRERVENIAGGELIIDSEIGKGTKAIIKLPIGE
ncbi:sensor histidine kinase [Butyrivibrio sp. NC2007]|uniref:sensor histidine kinase n=1 Tax=Butyrivibrio sp. NC2007 TaxID=1280683 RepID=UPI0003FDD5F8|nr:histidine kinase [Butyrivibrio sp. NC2007]